jgi:hypothetical protein
LDLASRDLQIGGRCFHDGDAYHTGVGKLRAYRPDPATDIQELSPLQRPTP